MDMATSAHTSSLWPKQNWTPFRGNEVDYKWSRPSSYSTDEAGKASYLLFSIHYLKYLLVNFSLIFFAIRDRNSFDFKTKAACFSFRKFLFPWH